MKRKLYREIGTNHAGRLLVFASPELEANELNQTGHLLTIVDTGVVVEGTPVNKPIIGASMLGFVQDADYISTPEHGDVLVVY